MYNKMSKITLEKKGDNKIGSIYNQKKKERIEHYQTVRRKK